MYARALTANHTQGRAGSHHTGSASFDPGTAQKSSSSTQTAQTRTRALHPCTRTRARRRTSPCSSRSRSVFLKNSSTCHSTPPPSRHTPPPAHEDTEQTEHTEHTEHMGNPLPRGAHRSERLPPVDLELRPLQNRRTPDRLKHYTHGIGASSRLPARRIIRHAGCAAAAGCGHHIVLMIVADQRSHRSRPACTDAGAHQYRSPDGAWSSVPGGASLLPPTALAARDARANHGYAVRSSALSCNCNNAMQNIEKPGYQ